MKRKEEKKKKQQKNERRSILSERYEFIRSAVCTKIILV